MLSVTHLFGAGRFCRNDVKNGAFANRIRLPKAQQLREQPTENQRADDTRKAFEKGERLTREALDKGTATAEQATRRAEQSYSNAAGGIADLNTKMMEMAQANTIAGLEFIRDLSAAKGPTEAFEVWSKHAQGSLERLANQSQELASLGQKVFSSSADPFTRRAA